MSDKLIEIVQDHTSLVQALRLILDSAETKKLPSYATIPTFNDSILDDQVITVLEFITGDKYPA